MMFTTMATMLLAETRARRPINAHFITFFHLVTFSSTPQLMTKSSPPYTMAPTAKRARTHPIIFIHERSLVFNHQVMVRSDVVTTFESEEKQF